MRSNQLTTTREHQVLGGHSTLLPSLPSQSTHLSWRVTTGSWHVWFVGQLLLLQLEKKKKNEAHPNCQASQTSVPILKVLLSLWGRLVGMLPSTEQWLSYVPLMRNEVRGSFSYMDVRRENTRLRVSIRILYLKAPGVTQEDEKNWRLKCVAPHLCFNFHF